jgi:hypothetical protein
MRRSLPDINMLTAGSSLGLASLGARRFFQHARQKLTWRR